MKKFFLLFIVLLAITILTAKPIDFNSINAVAQNWYVNNFNTSPVQYNYFATDYEGITTYYTFNFDNHAFIILSVDDNVSPVLAYSFDSTAPQNVTDSAVKSYLKGLSRTVADIIRNKYIYEDSQKEWERLFKNDFSDLTNYAKDVTPIVDTRWDQDYPYNMYCPMENGQRTYTGCVATAMAQIMKTNNYPEHGEGSHSYTWNGQTLSADFENTTYQWDLMPNHLYSSSPLNQRQAVATLMYHCGVATDMDYGLDGSGTYTSYAESAFQLYFRYDPYTVQLRSKNSYSSQEWIDFLKADLDDGFPILYAGDDGNAGHAFVCDGYQGSNFHFNWGWSGYYDGYFNLNNLNPMGYNFNQHQQAIFGIRPPQAPVPPQNLTAMVLNLDVLLTWEAPSNKPLTGYKIYRDGEEIEELNNPSNISYYDMQLPAGEHTYYVTAIYSNPSGESEPSNIVTVNIGADAQNNVISSNKSAISKIYPNPFNSMQKAPITVNYSLSKNGNVSLAVYNVKGQKIANLVSSYQDKGDYKTYWTGKDKTGKQVAAGIYLFKMSIDNNLLDIKKMLIIK